MPDSSDLARTLAALKAKSLAYGPLYAYYDGDQSIAYATVKLQRMFRSLAKDFRLNLCAVVVDSVLDRLELQGLTCEAAATQLDDLWTREEWALLSDEVHEDLAITGEGFVISWPDESDTVRTYRNDPRLVCVGYSDEDPTAKTFAGKWWQGSDALLRVVLYYADRFEHYVSASKITNGNVEAKSLQPDEAYGDGGVEANESGIIPVTHFRGRGRNSLGELSGRAVEPQNAVNKLIADMMVSAEFAAFKQRWAITNADVSKAKAAPDTIVKIPPANKEEGEQPAAVGEFSATDLKNFLDAIEYLTKRLATITRTPLSQFQEVGASVSGDALVAMEAPLVKKVGRYQKRAAAGWRELAVTALGLSGVTIEPADVVVSWVPAETQQPVSEGLSIKALTDAGIPKATVLRRHGWSDDELAQMAADESDEQQRGASYASALLDSERARFEAQGAQNGGA